MKYVSYTPFVINNGEYQVLISTISRHGEIVANLSKLEDFNLFSFKPEQGLFVKGFGKAFQVSTDELVNFVHLDEGHQQEGHKEAK